MLKGNYRLAVNGNVSGSVSILLLISFLLLVPSGCQPIKALGKNPTGEDLKRIEKLPNYENGQFQNIERSYVGIVTPNRRGPRWLGLLKFFVGKPAHTKPSEGLPTAKTDLKTSTFDKPTVVWFGHSSFLLKANGANILFDPNFSGFAGPFPGLIDAFKGSNVYNSKDMPPIDAIVISHDHYDHLDYNTVKQLRKRTKRIIVPIGVGSHFRKWGFDPAMITELNWNESIMLNDQITITATPAHHRSNRGLEQRKTLWASYVIKAGSDKIYFSGDTGYSKHFKMIGDQYGPFDLAMMECGQYNKKWPGSHMFPTQTVQASLDLRAKTIIPIHWGKFAESEHTWNEPVKLLLPSADSAGLSVSVPFIGQPYSIGDIPQRFAWWDFQ